MSIRMDTLVRFQHSVLFYTFTSYAINQLQSLKFKAIPLSIATHSFSLTLSSLIDLIVGVFGADKAVLYRYRMLMHHFELTHAFD